MVVIVQFRRDTAAKWTLNNPTLAEGEFGLELDTGYFKEQFINLMKTMYKNHLFNYDEQDFCFYFFQKIKRSK